MYLPFLTKQIFADLRGFGQLHEVIAVDLQQSCIRGGQLDVAQRHL